MQISEQNKQEADKVMEKHTFVSQIQRLGIGQDVYQQTNKIEAINHAIQDRQSVLDENIANLKIFKTGGGGYWICNNAIQDKMLKRITNLKEQLEYLKAKL